jgi:hypothetical protein
VSTATHDWFVTEISWDYFPSDEPVLGKSFTQDSEVIKYFTAGQCNALAWEIFKRKRDEGYMLAMLSDDKVGTREYMGHLFVVDADQEIAIDIQGAVPLDDMFDAWPNLGHFHVFRSTASFRKEMKQWRNDTPYNRDPEAAYWADVIVDKLGS